MSKKKMVVKGLALLACVCMLTTSTSLAQDTCESNYDYDYSLDSWEMLLSLDLEEGDLAQVSTDCRDFCKQEYPAKNGFLWWLQQIRCRGICRRQCERIGVKPCIKPSRIPNLPPVTRCSCLGDCCDLSEECCRDQNNLNGICCAKNEDCCLGLDCCEPGDWCTVRDGCCPSENEVCGFEGGPYATVCCDNGKVCCEDDRCCPDDKCVDGVCGCDEPCGLNDCCDIDEVCENGQCVNCTGNKELCGDTCCPPDKCIDNECEDVFCPTGEVCGEVCCSPGECEGGKCKTALCYGGYEYLCDGVYRCCEPSDCCTPDESCNTNGYTSRCCSPNEGICWGKGEYDPWLSYCCLDEWACCGRLNTFGAGICCPPGSFCCTTSPTGCCE